ncbi:hypothetical protein OG333_35775 [Streptomyces anulatus]|uniref:hypothetical protein n=1 Tax=Streptomyces TaxID=1883 RepID=UPI0015CF24F4|nr:hypothetical protein [Streptomyces sp. or20]WSV79410.1 hypothetical protein OG333_35775 [Streptomyces anulatus]
MSQPGSIRARIPAQTGDREIVIAGPRAAARLALVSLVINWAVNNLAALLLTGLVPSKGIAPIPITGILIGGALTVRNRWSAHSELWQR